jgi:hypothetical protein
MSRARTLSEITASVPAAVRWKLDQEIDFEHGGVPQHLGRIADVMSEWQGIVADQLGLSRADTEEILERYHDIKLQGYK